MKGNILVGISGGIAAYKTIELVTDLIKAGYAVKVVMTPNARQFVRELPFRIMTKNRVFCDVFARDIAFDTDHIELAKWADLLVLYPATANIIAKVYAGIADDLLTTVVSAMPDKAKIICPAMNNAMWDNPIVQRNIADLRALGSYHFIAPKKKRLACGEIGTGALCDREPVVRLIETQLSG